jgi:WD40 repeat protein
LPVAPGQNLLHYRLVDKLGEGGMGVVWRALDTTLDRETAIKVLPERVAADSERLARFEREARLLATLNHPNIAGVYGSYEANDVRFIAMELVAGEDLAARIKRGALPMDEAVKIAQQIAGAVEAAHENGVIHRDLKPANVVVSDTGQVKVLDFGLAKALSAAAGSSEASPSLSPTLTSVGSVAGVILGTAAYMSPEQAKGRTVDRRADIWSFGCLLYEMLTGRRTFEGETVSETLASVLKDDVAWNALPAATPRAVLRLLRRCLDRDPNTRLRDIGEARVALSAHLDEPPAAAATSAGRRQTWVAIAAAAIMGLAGLAAGWSLRQVPPKQLTKLDMADLEMKVDNLHRPVLSPDGSRIAYFSQGTLWIRDLDRAVAREIPDSRLARDAFWSGDGTQIAFHRDEELHRALVDGGAPVPVARTGALVSGAGGCWSDDGRIVYSLGNTSLYEVPALGGKPRVLLAPDKEKREHHFHGCSFLPDNRGMLFVVHPEESTANTIAVLADNKPRYLLELPDEAVHEPAWSPSGHIVFHRSGGVRDGVWALPFDLSRLEPTGEPFPIATGGAVPSVAANGSLLYAPTRMARGAKLVWVLPDGTVDGTAVEFDHPIRGFSLSPDGSWIAAAVVAGGVGDLWVADLTRGTKTQLTHGPGWASAPDWSSDGKRVAFSRNNQVHLIDVSSGDPSYPIGPGLAPTFSHDDRQVVAQRIGDDGTYELWLLDVAGQDEARLLVREGSSARWADVSPDGRFMAYSRGDGINQLFLTRFPDASGRWQVSADTGGWVRWSSDGKRLFYAGGSPEDIASHHLFEVEFEDDPEVELGVPRPLFSLSEAGVEETLETTRDDRFLMQAGVGAQSVTRLVLVQNWYEEFR